MGQIVSPKDTLESYPQYPRRRSDLEVMVFADIVKFRGDQAGLGWALNGDRCP